MTFNIFGSIQVLHHETRILSFLFSASIFSYFFFITKESVIIRLISSALWVFAGNLLCEVPWIFGYFLFKGGWILALDVVSFALGEAFIILAFNYLIKKGFSIPSINLKKWLFIFTLVCVSIIFLIKDGFYPLWMGYENGTILIDPHTVYPLNLEWSIGKAIGMLGWIWIVRGDNK